MLEKMKQKKNFIIVAIVILVVLILSIISNIKINQLKEEKESNSIEFSFTTDYSKFNVSINDFEKKIRYELKKRKISSEEMKKWDNNDEYTISYNYAIELENGDIILLYTDDKGKTIEHIAYDYNSDDDSYNAGVFTELLSSLFIENYDYDDFIYNYSIYTSNDNSWNYKSRYAYEHILYGINTGADYLYYTFSVVEETTNEEYIKSREEQEKQLQEYLKELESNKQEDESKEDEEESIASNTT